MASCIHCGSTIARDQGGTYCSRSSCPAGYTGSKSPFAPPPSRSLVTATVHVPIEHMLLSHGDREQVAEMAAQDAADKMRQLVLDWTPEKTP